MVILDTSYLLRGRSIWEIPCLKIVLGAGERFLVFIVIKKIIYFRVGDRRSISLWFDNWHPLGPLVEVFGDRTIMDSGLGREVR
jgi:hypothetical protein